MVSTNLMNFTKRLTVVHHSNSSARYDDVFWLFFYQHAAAVLRSSDVGCMAIVQQVGVHGQEGGGVRRAQLSGGSNIQRGALPHWPFGLK